MMRLILVIVAHLGSADGYSSSSYLLGYQPWTLPVYLLIWLIPLAALIGIAYVLLRLPLRRQERGRLFLDLLESELKEGRTPEHGIVQFSRCGDRVLGWRFHLLAAYLENGLRLSEALKKVPGLVPSSVAAMLGIGATTGYLRRVLPECRSLLNTGISQVTSGVNYLVILFLVLQPFGMLIWPFLATFVTPKFTDILGDLSGARLPPWVQFLAEHKWSVVGTQVLLFMLVLAVGASYVVGPWLGASFSRLVRPIADQLELWLSWRRKRLQRTFSRMLTVLLDAEVPEYHAVMLAAESTANTVFIRRAEAVVAQLRAGVKLTDAVTALDEAGEFRWRLTNATAGQAGFMVALNGWCEALEAKAYQQEQAVSQVVTTSLVILNGVIVGLIATGLFQALTSIIKQGVMW